MKNTSPGLWIAVLLHAVVPPAHAEDRPAVVRIALSSAVASGKGETGGIVLTAYRQRVLEQEFKAEGIRVEWSLPASGTATTEAFSRKLVDFAAQGDVGAISGRAAGLRHKVLLALNRYGSSYIVVRADSPAGKLEDLKGKRLGTIRGLVGDLSLRRILESEGMGEKDFEIINLKGNAAAVISALAAGEIDGHFMSQPFDLVAQGKVKVIYSSRRSLDISGLGVFLVSEEFEQRFPAIVQRIVNTLVRTAAWTSNEENREAVFDLWAGSTSGRVGIEKKWEGLSLKEGLSPLLDDYVWADLQRCVRDARRFGFITQDVSLAGWLEATYLRRAIEEQKLQSFWPSYDALGRKMVTADRP